MPTISLKENFLGADIQAHLTSISFTSMHNQYLKVIPDQMTHIQNERLLYAVKDCGCLQISLLNCDQHLASPGLV